MRRDQFTDIQHDTRTADGDDTVPDEEPLLELAGLDVTFETNRGNVEAVNGVDLTVNQGEIVGVVGESGSGKSVTAQSIIDLVPSPPAVIEGEIWYKGRDLTRLTKREMREVRGAEIGMIFQDPLSSLNPVHTIGRQVKEALTAHGGFSGTRARDRAIELLESVGIPEAAERLSDYPFEFSGGMRQRVMIAIALANQPDLLIADEPSTALDVTIEAQVLETIQELRDDGMGVILITHDFGVIAEVADRVAVMYGGKVIESGDVFEIFDEPKHPYTRGLLESIPGTSMQGNSDRLEAIEGEPPDMTELPSGCTFHPRCPERMPHCSEAVPPAYLVDNVGDGDSEERNADRNRTTNDSAHTARCYLYEDCPTLKGDAERDDERTIEADDVEEAK